MTDLRKAAELALDALEILSKNELPKKGAAKAELDEVVIPILRQALSQPEQEPVAYVPEFYCGEKISLSQVKLGQKFVLVRTGQVYSKTTEGYWNEEEQRPARLHLNCQVKLLHTIDKKQDQKTPLKVLNLTVFTENRLQNGRVYDVETLQAMTNRDILAIPDIGKKALAEVLEALNVHAVNISQKCVDETAKREHEPLVWMNKYGHVASFQNEEYKDPLYTAPPKREWVGLTDADKREAFDETQEASGGFWEFADYLEAKLKEKNT